MMKTRLLPFLTAQTGLALALWLAPSAAHADYAFHVSVNTSSLSAMDPEAPYSLDFQLIGNQGNQVSLTNFLFGTGGAAAGSPNPTGDVTGDLSNGITLSTSSTYFNDVYQQFTPGSLLQFDVNVTTNFAGGNNTPDGFSFAILDNSLSELGTDLPGSALLQVDLDGSPPTIYSSGENAVGFVNVTPNTTPVPEPVYYQMSALLALGGIGLWKRRRNRASR